MGLGRCWPEFPLHIIVDVDGGCNNVVLKLLDIGTVWQFLSTSEHPLHYIAEYLVE